MSHVLALRLPRAPLPASTASARLAALIGGLACVLPCAPAHADEPLWEAGAGIGGLRLPHYRGSDQHESWLLPLPYFVYNGKILRADRDGARALLFNDKQFDIDVSLAASAPARSDDDDARQGMPDLKPTLEVGPKLNLHLAHGAAWKLDVRLPLRVVTTIEARPHSLGWNIAPVLNLDTRIAGFDAGLQGGPLWNSQRLNAHYYDVAAPYVTAERPAYAAAGGYAGWQATASLSRRMGRFWAGAYVRTDSVSGAVFEDSPLVRSGRQWAAGFATAWVFAVSGERVTGND